MFRRNRLHGWEERLIDGLIKVVERISGQPETAAGPRLKFVGYNELLKILEKTDCPVCYMLRNSLQHYLSVEFIEELTVPEFREPLRSSLGYCNKHSEYVRRAARNPLQAMGVAVVYKDLLDIVQSRLTTTGRVGPTGICPLCIIQLDIESYALQLLADYAHDEDFQRHYEEAQGLCVGHLHAALRVAHGEASEFLAQSHERKLNRLMADLDEFIRKHDYRFAGETMTEAEAHSWQRAVRSIVGS